VKSLIHKTLMVASAVACALLLVAPTAQARSAPSIHRGGSVTVLETGVAWPSLDPATNAIAALNANLMNAVYGQLFEQGPKGTFVPDLATGYAYTNKQLTLTISLRHGVTFQDGTPFTAPAVAANFNRVLEPQFACICDSSFSDVSSITASGNYKVVLQLKLPNATILEAILDEGPDWVPSPTALANEPEATFAQHPIGAGPFEVVSNEASAELVLQKFPKYWEKGEPYLNSLTFEAVSSDQSAYAALQSGSAQVSLNFTTAALVGQAKAQFYVDVIPGVYSGGVRFNTLKPPFNNILARQAVYYATDPATILQVVSPGFGTLVQSVAGPADGYYEKTVPGYPKYDLAKAQALVQQLGGLSFQLLGGTTPTAQAELAALQNEYEQAGMTVSIKSVTTPALIGAFQTGSWTGYTGADGSIDPDVGILGLAADFEPGGALSGVNDATLTGLINQSEQYINPTTRQKIFDEIYKDIATQAYNAMLYATPDVAIVSHQLVGAHIVAGPSIMMNFEGVHYK
jgi:peptide/nickel transport system substrate-binding protein